MNSPPDLFLYIFCNFFREFVAATDFFVTPMRSSGSRVDIAQKPNKSGQILDHRWKYFCNFYEINSSQNFFLHCKNFGVDGTQKIPGERLYVIQYSNHCDKRTQARHDCEHKSENALLRNRNEISQETIPKQVVHAIPWVTNEYV